MTPRAKVALRIPPPEMQSAFESYRALGEYTVSQICEAIKPVNVNTVKELIEAAQTYAK